MGARFFLILSFLLLFCAHCAPSHRPFLAQLLRTQNPKLPQKVSYLIYAPSQKQLNQHLLSIKKQDPQAQIRFLKKNSLAQVTTSQKALKHIPVPSQAMVSLDTSFPIRPVSFYHKPFYFLHSKKKNIFKKTHIFDSTRNPLFFRTCFFL